jgi:DNA-binding transcriptional MerR regulator
MTDRRPDATLTLEELTSDAGVTVRTVRYYIAEGLLPPPEGAGRAARYTEEHRNRLDLIASLKDRHLPLREIRQFLRDLSPEEIAGHADRARQDQTRRPKFDSLFLRSAPEGHPMRAYSAGPPEGDDERGPDDALGYIRSIREPSPVPYQAPPVPAVRKEDQRWRRLEISPEAELMVTEEVWRRRREQIDTLLSWARRIISGS